MSLNITVCTFIRSLLMTKFEPKEGAIMPLALQTVNSELHCDQHIRLLLTPSTQTFDELQIWALTLGPVCAGVGQSMHGGTFSTPHALN